MDKPLGTLKRVDPRAYWPHEQKDFTPWLAENLDKLGAVLGMDLDLIQSESPIGDFSMDIYAQDLSTAKQVVIENQLEPTNHDHLGKLITYAAGVDAEIVIWICREFRDEHRQALDWLNRGHAKTDFFGIVVELLQIDDSNPAISFRLIASPNDWSKPNTRGSRQPSSRMQKYQSFFQRLIDELREKHAFTNARKGQPQSWYWFKSGAGRMYYGASFALGGKLRTELYIDPGDEDQNAAVLEVLREDEQAIVDVIGEKLEWEELEGKRACRIAVYRDGSIDDPDDKYGEYIEWFVSKLILFRTAFSDRIKELA